MKDGFIKVAAATPDVRVADCEYNATEIIRMIHEMEEQGAKVMVFPELCITGYTCQDLFLQRPVEICSGRRIFWKRRKFSLSVLQKKQKRWTH